MVQLLLGLHISEYKITFRIAAFFLLGLFLLTFSTEKSNKRDASFPEFQGTSSAIPDSLLFEMKQYSWRKDCPVALAKLRLLTLTYWGFDDTIHSGLLIVHQSIAQEVLDIFAEIYTHRFPIAKMRLIEKYGGDDDSSMADNNTSAFNCRSVLGKPGVFSKHSFGVAIDINPLNNPFVTKKGVFPPEGKKYVDRTKKMKGMMFPGNVVHRAFTKRGWIWGGAWKSVKDYQHFQKAL